MPTAALASLQDLLDRTANDPDADPAQRVANLRTLRADLVALTGECDRYVSDNELQRESAAMGRAHDFLAARENADVRGVLLDRRAVTPEQADAAGLLSHEDLDRRRDDGLLEAGIVGVFNSQLHPRGLRGRFGASGRVKQKSFRKQARELDTNVADQIARTPAPSAGAPTPGTTVPAPPDTGPVPDVNAPLNAAGKTSQKRLLALAKGALSQPATVDVYSHTDGSGKRVYDKSRQALHQKIIEKMLAGAKSQKKPEVVFTGGGHGAGKGGIVRRLKEKGKIPEGAVTLDPDKIKAALPEFQQMLKDGDPEANLASYEEAWDIAKAVQAEGQKRKLHMVVDGLGNTSPEDMLARVKSFRDAGYAKATAHYATTDPEKAIETTQHRATKASARPEDRRYIPEDIVRAAHRDVAASLPGIIAGSRKPGEGLDEIHVHDTSAAATTDAKGDRHYPEPKAVFSAVTGKKDVVHDEQGWQQALGRASGEIAGVEKPARADTAAALEEIQKLGLDKYPDETDEAKKVLGGARDTQEMHAGDSSAPGMASTGIMYRGEGLGGAASPGTEQPDLVTDPGVEYDVARKAVHDRIISAELSNVVGGLLPADHPVAKKLAAGAVATDLSPDEREEIKQAAYDARGGENPDFLFLAGGPASGKSTALKTAPELIPEHAVTLAPDEYMEQLPEYKTLHDAGDVYAASAGHEESTDVAKRLQRESELLGLNMVADGVGNSKAAVRDEQGKVTEPGKFAKKLIRANDAGYQVSALTVTVPTNVAAVRSVRRALGDGVNPGNGKLVPLPALEEQHGRVSENFPEIAALPFLKDVRVVDTQGQTPVTIAHGSGGQVEEDDPEMMADFLAKNPKAKAAGG